MYIYIFILHIMRIGPYIVWVEVTDDLLVSSCKTSVDHAFNSETVFCCR